MAQTVALAVDGMEFSLLSKWIDQGQLPNFREIQGEGAFGTADCSSLSSAKQWTTHFTGVHPAQHGISGFTKNEKQRSAGDRAPESSELINLSDIPVKTYPELLSEYGTSVGLINPLPIWPPLELQDGFCISGLLTPPTTDRWFNPPELSDALEDHEYQIDIRYGNRPYGFVDDHLFEEIPLSQIYEDIFDVLETRIEYTKYAIRNHPTEYLYILLKSIDVIQHCFWAHMETDESEYENAILESYSLVDDLIGWLRENYDVNLLVFSDHGFQARTTTKYPFLDSLAAGISRNVKIPDILRRVYRSHTIDVESTDAEGDSVTSTTGAHANPASWFLVGPDIESTARTEIAFEDLTPTILTLLDEPIPDAYVGSPLSCVNHEPRFEKISLDVRRQLQIEESEVVSERLHNLGYAEMVDE